MTAIPHSTPARPVRIQRRRTKGWRMPEGAVYVGRPTVWGNPYRGAHWTRQQLVDVFSKWVAAYPGDSMYGQPPRLSDIQQQLRGKNLACWCPLDQPCHADVLLELANTEAVK